MFKYRTIHCTTGTHYKAINVKAGLILSIFKQYSSSCGNFVSCFFWDVSPLKNFIQAQTKFDLYVNSVVWNVSRYLCKYVFILAFWLWLSALSSLQVCAVCLYSIKCHILIASLNKVVHKCRWISLSALAGETDGDTKDRILPQFLCHTLFGPKGKFLCA